MTTRDIQREETKKRIYDVAFKLFDEFGYDKVKVSDIAKAANVSVGSVYYHYKNKEAIIDYGYYEFDQMLKEAYEKQTFDSEREAILFLIDFQIKDVFLDIGLKMTTICFKNQINAENTYLHSDERYLYQKLLENLNNNKYVRFIRKYGTVGFREVIPTRILKQNFCETSCYGCEFCIKLCEKNNLIR